MLHQWNSEVPGAGAHSKWATAALASLWLAGCGGGSDPTPPAAAPSTVASLPADMLLAPAAADCASLRSGKYRLVVNEDGGTTPSTQVLTIDAPGMKITNGFNEVIPMTARETCSYVNTSTGTEVVVTKSGVIVARVNDGANVMRGAVAFPEQSHSVAELAGDWNTLGFDRTDTNGPIHLTSATFSIDSTGKLTAINHCDDLRTCVASPPATLPAVTVTANAAGGFNIVNAGNPDVDRLFAYRAGGGELMSVTLAKSGHISFATRKAPIELPPVGRIQESRNLTLTATYTAPTVISMSRNTVVSVDTAAGSFLRNAVIDFTTSVTRPEVLVVNSLREGYGRRPPATVTQSDGTTATVGEFISLPMRGMDFTPVALPAANQLILSAVSSTVVP